MIGAAWLAGASCAISAFGAIMTRANLARLRPAPRATALATPLVSVCIPARDEAANLEACVRAVLASTGANLEVLVYDDQSVDDTPGILSRLCAADSRVRRVETSPLPEGWNGKQHACWRLAAAARGEWLIFTDADVRFAPTCVARATSLASRGGLGLVSAFPRQLVGTPGEAVIVPMIFFILLMYLPFGRMRTTLDPAASAACGQFLCVSREAYNASGGHAMFKDSMHDGVKMPRAVRRAGFRTDLFDGSDVLECRMYRGLSQSWRGFAKNAYEGLSSVALLVFLTVMHLVGYLLPWAGLAWAGWHTGATSGPWPVPAMILWVISLGLAVVQVNQVFARGLAAPVPGFGATMLLPRVLPVAGVLSMTLIQWHSYLLHVSGRRTWRGRGLAPLREPPVKTV